MSEGAGAAVDGAYARVAEALADRRCLILDGATATELPAGPRGPQPLQERLWGTGALIDHPDQVRDVHRRYVDAGVDIVSTNTWGLPSGLAHDAAPQWHATEPVHWMDIARRASAVARQAVADGGREGECAVAFSLNGDVDRAEGMETIRLLGRVFADDPPDLVLVETLSLIRPSLYRTVEALLETGLPVWLSFRRCRHGLCGAYGQHWGGPEGDLFGRAARQLEELGISALLVNCIPPDHVRGIVPYLRDFTDLPLGVYPNLGYFTEQGWRSETGVGGHEYADMAVSWRAEGAQIIGGCCGVGPAHIEAARERLADVPPGTARRYEAMNDQEPSHPPAAPAPWKDGRDRSLYPLPVPAIAVHDQVTPPTAATYMAWKHLFRERIGAGRRCLEVGSGTGLLTVQLALNGAAHVHAIDVDPGAVDNTLDNAFRNRVSDQVTGAAVDLYPWVPDEPYDVVVANLAQTPVDPFQQVQGHRPADYWGRNVVDQLLEKLPAALGPDGRAYVVHLSLLSQAETASRLERLGLVCEVVDFEVQPFSAGLVQELVQIGRVEELSDANHLVIGDEHAVVAYLLDIRPAQ